jgi:hypothetical protein
LSCPSKQRMPAVSRAFQRGEGIATFSWYLILFGCIDLSNKKCPYGHYNGECATSSTSAHRTSKQKMPSRALRPNFRIVLPNGKTTSKQKMPAVSRALRGARALQSFYFCNDILVKSFQTKMPARALRPKECEFCQTESSNTLLNKKCPHGHYNNRLYST